MKKLFLLAFLSFSVMIGQERKCLTQYPEIENIAEKQIRHGVTVLNEYQNLEDLEAREVQNWFQAQDSLTEIYFSNNLIYKSLIPRFNDLQKSDDEMISTIRISESGSYFYLVYDTIEEKNRLVFREALSSKEEEIPLPESYKDSEITYLEPSYDGKKLAVGFQQGEEFDTTIIIYDLITRSFLKEKITNMNPDFGELEWLPDCSGFVYLYFPVVDQNEEGYKRNSFSVLHFLGDDPLKRTKVFGTNKQVNISSDYYPKVKIGSSSDKWIIGYAANSGDHYDAFVAKVSDLMKGKPLWKKFFSEEDKIYFNQGEVRGDQFIFRSATHPGNTLGTVNIPLPDFNEPKILARGTNQNPITKFVVAENRILFSRSEYGVAASLYEVDSTGSINKINLPSIPGDIHFFRKSILHDEVGIGLDGWTSDYTRYYLGPDNSLRKEDLVPSSDFPEFADLISTQTLVISHDGVEVPLSLIYKKGIEPDGNNEIFMYVYGAYGESMTPFFSPIFLDWAAQGGILAFPHVRGGGEKGKDWHLQGMKNLKPNSWKDLNACTEALISEGWTSKGLVALYTSSAGAVTAGMGVNERPDLYSSFIAEVPRLNPYGLEVSSTTSSTSYLEYGSVKDSIEFRGLLQMDPFLNIKQGVSYPAVLVMSSSVDDRIPLWDSGKYIAKIQELNLSCNPLYLDINYSSGHTGSSITEDISVTYSKIFSFARSNMLRKEQLLKF